MEAESPDSHPWSCGDSTWKGALPLDSPWGSALNECANSFEVLGD